MFKWLIDKQIRAELAELDAKITRLDARIIKQENLYGSLKNKVYNSGSDKKFHRSQAAKEKELTPQEKQEFDEFCAGCAPGDAEMLRAKLINQGYRLD